jgi:hypothetical protein
MDKSMYVHIHTYIYIYILNSKIGSVTTCFITGCVSNRVGDGEMSRCRVEGTYVLLHDQSGNGNSTRNRAGLVYRATPSDDRPNDDMLGGAGSQQMPETEMIPPDGFPFTT